jgi:radical SAM superfamily enzyme YgiQ (UPF0313 family)
LTSLLSINSITLGETDGSLSLVLSPLATLTFDRAGRPLGLYEKGFYVARGLDGRCLEKKWIWEGAPDARRHLRELSVPEREQLRRRISDLLTLARESLPALAKEGRLSRVDRGRPVEPSPAWIVEKTNRLSAFVTDQWDEDAHRFNRLWRPIGILPPDQYLSLVIQAVEGCAWNRCAFCDFYARRPFRVRSREEISRHTDEAAVFFGEALAGRCSIFIGDANAFQAPPDLLVPVAEELAARFPRLARPQADGVGGLYAFAEAARLAAWSPADLRALKDAGFHRAYLGVETGSDALRRELQKPGSADTVLSACEKLKEAGIRLGLIVLLGAGGRERAANHLEGTAALLQRAPLGPGDLLYFSPLIPEEGSAYAQEALRQGWTPLSEKDLAAQRRNLDARLPRRGERRALYDIREFLY